MRYLRSIVTWIDSLESGEQFRKWASILVKITGVFVLIGTIVEGIALCIGPTGGMFLFQYGKIRVGTLGFILALCINVIIGLVLVILLWNRANKIRVLGDETHFTLLSTIIILIRLFGELKFLLLVGIGIQTLMASIFGSEIPNLLLRISLHLLDTSLPELISLRGNLSFISGVISFVRSVLIGAGLLIFAYFIAELINLFVDMATNLKKIETTPSTEETASNS